MGDRPELDDTDLMLFGKHQGTPMLDVPADYLHWLWTHGKSNELATCPVARYIKRNISSLAIDYPDGIWD